MNTRLDKGPILVPKGYNYSKQYDHGDDGRDTYIAHNNGGWTVSHGPVPMPQPGTTYTA